MTTNSIDADRILAGLWEAAAQPLGSRPDRRGAMEDHIISMIRTMHPEAKTKITWDGDKASIVVTPKITPIEVTVLLEAEE